MKIRTSVAALSAAALAASMALTTSPAQASPAFESAPLQAAVTWLNAQVASGPLQSKSSEYGNYDNIGATIDAATSLHAVSGSSVPQALIDDVANGVQNEGYADSDEYAFTPPYAFVQHGIYANATAKALSFALLAGQDPTSFGGEDLLTQLEGTIQASGRIQDDSSYGDYANVYGQAFAVNGLYEAEQTADATKTLGFLATQQCTGGYFPENFGTTNLDETCDQKNLTADVDATATVVLELQPLVAANDTTATDIVNSAVSWLIGAQAEDGSWGDDANSTGLAGWALGVRNHPSEAAKAAEWVRGRQLTTVGTCAPFASADLGALALNDAGFDAAKGGITLDGYNAYAVATAQALPVLKWVPLSTSSPAISGPSGYVQGGTSATYQVSGFKPGARACVTQGATSSLVATDSVGAASPQIALPSTTGTATVSASDGTTTSSVDTKVLGATTLTVTPSEATASVATPLTVAVSGLANAEAVTVTVQGKSYSGTASASGTFTTPATTITSAGVAPVTAVGQFTNRTGSASVSVSKAVSGLSPSAVTPTKLTVATGGSVSVSVISAATVDGGVVTASENGATLASARVAGGNALLAFPALTAGKHVLTLAFTGTDTVASSTASVTFTVEKVAPTLKASVTPSTVHPSTKAKVTVTVKAGGANPNGGKLTAKSAKGKNLASLAVKNGKVTLTLPKLNKGKQKITLIYAGTSTTSAKATTIVINVR
jgi:hypothetical protein